jgi:hypothetical protein
VPQKNARGSEILDDMCISFGALLQAVGWLRFKEFPIQPIQSFIEVADAGDS